MKSKIFAILFALSLTAPVATTYFILQHQKKLLKKEIKWKIIAGIDRDELVLLKFTEEGKKLYLKWKHSKEFEYKGEMYDIVEQEVKGDTTYYWCWWDNEETMFNKQIAGLVSFAAGNTPKSKENQKLLNKFFNSLFLLQAKEIIIFPNKTISKILLYKQNLHPNNFYSPLEPPPKAVFSNTFA